ncbi:MAG: hypothetical protein JNK02_03590 [Planctomycetes bacterium]|nr:hypothetical protein [Planctomycetota bacterium]
MKNLLLGTALLLLPAPATAQSTLFFEGFEHGLDAWTIGPDSPDCWWGHGGGPCTGSFFVAADTDPCSPWAAPFPEGTHAVRFGYQGQCTFQPPGINMDVPDCSMITATPLAIPATGSTRLTFWSKSEGEDDSSYDRRRIFVQVEGTTSWVQVGQLWNSDWASHGFDLSRWAGQSLRIKFKFEGVDNAFNDYMGWYLDQITVENSPAVGAPFCSGDGSAADCPCGNVGAPGRGCATSFAPQGALLAGVGDSAGSADTVVLTATDVSNSVVTYFQGTTQQAFGLGATFGDGLRCAGGTTLRLRSVPASANTAVLPGPSDPSLSVLGAIPVGGGMRTYQVWYRNAADFCTTSTFNLTNGLAIHWRP